MAGRGRHWMTVRNQHMKLTHLILAVFASLSLLAEPQTATKGNSDTKGAPQAATKTAASQLDINSATAEKPNARPCIGKVYGDTIIAKQK